jgi:DNA-directed RNA polymerase beta' subunit
LLKKETHIADLIKAEMEYENMDIETIKTFLHSINLEPESITGELKSELFKLAEKIIENKVITYKRDPSENKDSWISSYVNVEDTGFVIKVNPYDLGKNTGDFDGDAASIYAVLTEEAQKQAKESMNPRHSKSCWYGGVNTNKPIYGLSLDAMCAIYSATKR